MTFYSSIFVKYYLDDELGDSEFPTYAGAVDNTVEIRTDSDTHIGVEKKTGGWLENETERILRFAGFKTQRERRVVFEESTNEHYRVDILAQYDDLTLFVECKDYSELKVNEKILFTLIGQVHDYRRDHPDETVVGILVTSAKNIGQNLGIQNKLLREGCQLWDGSTIQKFQEKMIDVDRKSEFTSYLLEKLGYVLQSDDTNNNNLMLGQHRFHCRMHFFSITAEKYIGNKFSHKSIIHDLKRILDGTGISVSSFSYKNLNTSDGDRMSLYVDFVKIISESKLNEYWKSKSGFFRKPKESPIELMEISFESACIGAITKTYGVEFNHPTGVYQIKTIATRSE